MNDNGKIASWFYWASLSVLLLLFVGFSIVVPIDSMAQASRSKNKALNTFIVVGAFVAFGVFSIVICVSRVLVQRSCLQDIPRRYLPITAGDMPHAPSRKLLHEKLNWSSELSELFLKPRERIVHDGLSPPTIEDVQSDNPSEDGEGDTLLPPFLNYEDTVKIITSRLKYQGVFSNLVDLKLDVGETFSEMIGMLFIEKGVFVDDAKEYVNLYETLRFDNKGITQDQFIRFMDLSLFFADELLKMNNINADYNDKVHSLAGLANSLYDPKTEPSNSNFGDGTYSLSESLQYSLDGGLAVPFDGNVVRRTNTSNTVARRVTREPES
ncbi:LAMI_0G00210g1_1 [Lachancea mirantina]|uniref:Defect at low temperature protein 1 n=1 Tax=Lachancea mirantina TaxID=1230905 RepID=A0A1G4K709_9SACH|nr:LAMI_0G00210g1_1 [Lachancea mirantina]